MVYANGQRAYLAAIHLLDVHSAGGGCVSLWEACGTPWRGHIWLRISAHGRYDAGDAVGANILFGVLHLIGAAVLLSALLRRFLDRAPALPGAIASFVLFLFLRSVPMGYLGIGELQLFELPRQLYSVPFLFPLGLPGPGFYSADYFPLIPWIFLFWTGLFLWRFLRPYAEETVRGWPACRPLVWLGRHSLWAYLLHQPVLLGFIFLLSILTGS